MKEQQEAMNKLRAYHKHYGPTGRKTLQVEPLPYNGQILRIENGMYIIHKAYQPGMTTMRGFNMNVVGIDELQWFLPEKEIIFKRRSIGVTTMVLEEWKKLNYRVKYNQEE
jgi:hypothetical protein